jgi:hypothetical protein
MKDGKAYEYARWAESTTPCAQIKFSDLAIAPTVPHEPESAFTRSFTEPIATMFTVPTGYNFSDPVCRGIDYICWPTVGVSSIEYYGSPRDSGIPGWEKVLMVTTLKRGSLYASRQRRWQSVRGRFRATSNRTTVIGTPPSARTEGRFTSRPIRGLAEVMAAPRAMTNKDRSAHLH